MILSALTSNHWADCAEKGAVVLAGGWQSMNRRLNDIRHVALDMDGTIYSGGTLFESTLPFLALMGKLGIGHLSLIHI